MGGWRGSKKTTVEECRSLGVKDLRRLGILRRGVAYGYWPISWRNADGEEVASIGLWAEEDGCDGGRLRLSYSVGRPGEEKESLNYSVRLDSTPCQFGGRRYWFTCPLVKGGVPCSRRVGKLYLPPGGKYFGCRHCYDLTYQSCQEHDRRVDRLMNLPPEELLAMARSGGLGASVLFLKAAMKSLRM